MVALDVLISVLDSCHAKNNDQGEENQSKRDGRKLGKELKNVNNEEETRRPRTVSEIDAKDG